MCQHSHPPLRAVLQSYGNTAIHVAAENGHVDAVRQLAFFGASVHAAQLAHALVRCARRFAQRGQRGGKAAGAAPPPSPPPKAAAHAAALALARRAALREMRRRNADCKTPMHLLCRHAAAAPLLRPLLRLDPALAHLPDALRATPLDVARVSSAPCVLEMQRALFFDVRYELARGAPAHVSDTCVVVFATEHPVEADEAALRLDYAPDAAAAQVAAGQQRPVALKFMVSPEAFRRELELRGYGGAGAGAAGQQQAAGLRRGGRRFAERHVVPVWWSRAPEAEGGAASPAGGGGGGGMLSAEEFASDVRSVRRQPAADCHGAARGRLFDTTRPQPPPCTHRISPPRMHRSAGTTFWARAAPAPRGTSCCLEQTAPSSRRSKTSGSPGGRRTGARCRLGPCPAATPPYCFRWCYFCVPPAELMCGASFRVLRPPPVRFRRRARIRHVARQLALCLDHMHASRVAHCDFKPQNAVRVGEEWRLIDLDAATRFGEPAGSKRAPPRPAVAPAAKRPRVVGVKSVSFLSPPFALSQPALTSAGLRRLSARLRCSSG